MSSNPGKRKRIKNNSEANDARSAKCDTKNIFVIFMERFQDDTN